MRDVLGLIENISSKAKVVIIADEQKLGDETKEFYTFKEKVIDRSYNLDGPDERLVTSLIEASSSDATQYKQVLTQLFLDYADGNIRTLFKSLDFINDISRKVIIDERLVRLCCALILESVKTKEGLKCDDFVRL